MHEVGDRQDADRRSAVIGNDDEAMDPQPFHEPGRILEVRVRSDADRRAGHEVADGEAGPGMPQALCCPRMEQVGLAHDTDERAGRIDDRQAAGRCARP